MTTLEIGQTVQRKDPGGDIVVRDIVVPEDLAYHQDLQTKGYEYTIIAGTAKPNLYTGGSVCTACEG